MALRVELLGGGFCNKGAELMLRTAAIEVGERLPGAELFLPMDQGTREQRRGLGAGDVVWLHHCWLPGIKNLHKRLAARWAAGTVPRELIPNCPPPRPSVSPSHWVRTAWAAQSAHSISPDNLDAVLDLSGFAYGDAWGPRDIRLRGDYFRHVRAHGAKVVLLPQQLGPFEQRQVREGFAVLANLADLVYARDPRSFAAAAAVVGDTAKLRLAPDFTTRFSVGAPLRPDLEGRACIVPNIRMLDKADAGTSAAYEGFLRSSVDILSKARTKPFLLIHDTTGLDLKIADRLRASHPRLEVVTDPDPFVLKQILGRALLVVASRFHALVSALSQGVPSLAIGWSHKYPALLEDYGCAEYSVDPRLARDLLRSKLQEMVEPQSRATLVSTLRARELKRIQSVDLMWEEICVRLTSRG